MADWWKSAPVAKDGQNWWKDAPEETQARAPGSDMPARRELPRDPAPAPSTEMRRAQRQTSKAVEVDPLFSFPQPTPDATEPLPGYAAPLAGLGTPGPRTMPEAAGMPPPPGEPDLPSSLNMRRTQRQTAAGLDLASLMAPVQPAAPAPTQTARPSMPPPATTAPAPTLGTPAAPAIPADTSSQLRVPAEPAMPSSLEARRTQRHTEADLLSLMLPEDEVQPAPPRQSWGDLGSRAARGVVEIGASVPETAAVIGAGNPNAAPLMAAETVQRARDQIALAERRLAELPDMSREQRARIDAVIEESRRTIAAYEPLVNIAEGPLRPDADQRPIYQRGEAIRQAGQELFGTPDPQFDDRFISKLAEGAGNMAGFIGATLLTGPLGGAAAGSAMNTAGMYRRAKQDGATEEQARTAAYIGSIVGASEVVPIAGAFRMLPSRLRQRASQAMGQRLANAFATAGEEGVQEALTEIANNLTAKGIYDPEQGVLEGAGESALIGAILGGGMGMVAGGAQDDTPVEKQQAPRQPRGDVPEPAAMNTTPEAPVQPKLPTDEAPAPAPQPEQQPLPQPDPQPDPQPEPAAAPVQPAPEAPEAPAQPEDPERYETLPEIDTSSGEPVETGRRVRIDKQTGELRVLDAEPSNAAPATDGAEQGGAAAPVVGSGPRPARPEAPAPAASAQDSAGASRQKAEPERRFLTDAEMRSVETDAEVFQYKDGGDAEGVTDRLQGVSSFDPNRAGQGVFYRTRDGRLIVADGHQRTGLAKRAAQAGQQDVGGMAAVIYNEADGHTPEDVMLRAAMKNVGEGSGSALDAARILRDRSETIEELGLPPRSALVRDAQGLRQLSDDAFGMVANGNATERDGAIVGRVVSDAALHSDILGLLGRLKPGNAAQAEMIARDAAADSQTETQTSLFGDEEVSQSLYLERAKILDGAMKGIRQDRATFNTLINRGETITGAGNQLDQDANQRRAVEDATVLEYLQRQANTKGAISDALSKAARDYKSGAQTLANARRSFLEDVKRALHPDDAGGSETGPRGGATGQLAPEGRQASAPEVTPQTERTDAGDQGLFSGIAPITERDRAESQMNRPMRGRDGGPGSGRDDLFGNPEDRRDLFDAGAAPAPEATPARKTDAELLADFEARIADFAADPASRDAPDNNRNIFDRVGPKLLRDLEDAGSVADRRKVADDFVVSEGSRTKIHKEIMVMLDADGQLISVSSGSLRGVAPPKYAYEMAAAGKVAYATHNHPGNRTFSPSDIAFFSTGTTELVAIGHAGSVVRSKPGKALREYLRGRDAQKDTFLAIKRAIDAAMVVLRREMQRQYNRNEITEAQGNAVLDHLLGDILHRHGVIDFTGETTNIVSQKGVDPDAIFNATDAAIRSQLGRAGLNLPEIRDRGRNPGSGRDGGGRATAPGRQGAARLPAQAAPDSDGNGWARAQNVEPDAFDTAADTLFGRQSDAAPEADAYDQAADTLFGPEPQKAKAGKPKAKPRPSKADDAAALNALFGQSPALQERAAGFDADRYAQAVPIFVRNIEGMDLEALSDAEAFVAMAKPLVDAGLSRDAFYEMRPYFEWFLAEARAGRIDLTGDVTDAPAPGSDVERDSGDAGASDGVGGTDVSAPAGGNGRGARTGNGEARRGDGQQNGRGRLPARDAAPLGGRGNRGVSGDGRPARRRNDGNGDRAGSRDRGEPGLRPDDAGPAATRREASDAADRVSAEPKAQPTRHHAEVAKAVPALHPEQVDDVVRIERRFFRPEDGKKTGYGILITNGTGTGKTMTAQGTAKRFLDRGAESILAVVKTQDEAKNWLDHAGLSGIDSMGILDDTDDNGAGRVKVAVTTYANLANNASLATREWELVLADEAHMLSSNKSGDQTQALKAFRAITNKPSHRFEKEIMLRHKDLEKARKIQNDDRRQERLAAIFDEAREAARKEEAKPQRKRAHAVFLSATPWAYDLNTDYGEGYLFDYPKDETRNGSRQSGRNWFMVENFGYRIRTHKLNKPEAAVDQGVFHREFHERLKREGALWGRKLDVDTDYDRKFVAVENELGGKIDQALRYLQDKVSETNAASRQIATDNPGAPVAERALADAKKWETLSKAVNAKFSYLKRMQLLEAMKAEAATADIRQHLEMGRKVVVFHDFNTGGGSGPFTALEGLDADARAALNQMHAELPWLSQLDFGRLAPPKDQILAAFGDRAVEYNGTVSKKARQSAKDVFNADGSGVDVIVVQSDAGSGGISLHDTTGAHKRVLVNLGMPTKPTTSLQAEGRTRRVGSVSDSPYRYYTIGTTWEREAFANRIAAQSGAVENLAMGNEARAIREAFIDAYENAARNPPSETDGIGGKDADLRNNALSDFDRAKSHYFGRQKMKGKRDQRAGIDFFPTPEPLALKMVEWAGIRPYDKVLEPSAGDGSISRYFPMDADRTVVEPSGDLASRAALLTPGARVVGTRFEDLAATNKYDAVVMNPPFGSGGKTAIAHLDKAFRHTRDGGRIVALIPTGPAADKRFDAWKEALAQDRNGPTAFVSASYNLPGVTFERAGTGVMARVVVIDRLPNKDAGTRIFDWMDQHGRPVDTDIRSARIDDFFDDIETMGGPARFEQTGPSGIEADMDAADLAQAEQAPKVQPPLVSGDPDAQFDTFEFDHSQTGARQFGAQVKTNLGDNFRTAAALAKQHGGRYSRYRSKTTGAKAGFLFPNADARDAFMQDMLRDRQSYGLEEQAYHGTPHDFDRFSSEFVGSGEGAQAFGWGMYFASRREIAEWYRDKLSRAKGRTGRLYSVEVPEADTLLDWDRPISEQPDKVQAALKNVPEEVWQVIDEAYADRGLNAWDNEPWDMPAGRFVKAISNYTVGETLPLEVPGSSWLDGDTTYPRHASMYLASLGIPGHRFLDQQSRSRGEGSHNYVIYRDEDVTITTKEQRPRAGQTMMNGDAQAQILPGLRAELDRLNLRRVRLGLDAPGNTRQGALTVNQLGQVDILIGQSLDPVATMYHEVIHAMRAMNLFTAEEWAALEADAGGWVEKHDIARRYPDLTPSEMIEEGIAEEFAERATSRQSPRKPVLVRAFNKIHRLLKAIRNAVRGAGFRTAEDVFGAVLAGRIGQRNADTAAMAKTVKERSAAMPRISRAAVSPGQPRPLPTHVPDRHLWEELTRSGAGVFERLTGARGALADRVDRARVAIQDRFLPVLRAQQAVERAIGRPLGDEHNAYITETTFSGKVGRHFFEIDEQFTKRIVDLIAGTNGGLTADNVGDWLAARHAKERNARIAQINPTMPDGGSGITNAEADTYLAQMAASPFQAELADIADLIDQLRTRTLNLRRDAGLLSPKEYLVWKTQYTHYVPLKGFAESDHAESTLDVTGLGRRYNIGGGESRMAMGRRSMAFNPLVAAITQAKETALRAEKNRVGQAAYRLARDHGSAAIWTVKTPQQKRYFNRTTGLVETRVDPAVTWNQAPNEFAVKVGGEEKRIVIHDERLIPALSSMGSDRLDLLTQMVGFYTRFQSMVNTMLNPEFVLRNAFRDFTAAQINLPEMTGEDRKGFGQAVAKTWPKAMMGAYRGTGGQTGTDWTNWFKEFSEAGAQISFWTLDNPTAGMDDLHRRIALARGPRAARILKAATSPRALFSTRDNKLLGFIERANLAVDNAVRLAAYAEARKRGWSQPQAAALAKNLTVNFNRRGTQGSLINSWFMFSNAAIQGLQVFLSVMTTRRGAFIGAGGVMLGLMLDMVNAALSEEDEDGKLAYDKIPDHRAQRTLLLQARGKGEDGFGNAYGVPLPYTYSLFPYAGTQIGKVMRGVKKPGEAFGDFLVAAASDVSPTGFGSIEQMLFPTLLKDLNEFADNEDWLGRNIRRENPWGDYGPMAYKYYAGASEASKSVADQLNRMTGGSAAESGLIDVSPEYLDHFAGKLTGGAGRFWGETADVLAKAMTGQASLIETRKIPWASDVLIETGSWYDRSAFYDNVDQINDAHTRVKLAREAGERPPRRYVSLDGLYTAANRARREMAALNDQVAAVRGNTALSSADKVKRIEAIERRQQRYYDALNRRFYQKQAEIDQQHP
ncbi:MAG: LPD38 domain-containing protein [Salipiger marinus]|uniref:LPD38 domain-containing protein n=1 Tax=Salipiger marinus TaxID=555512 RepID=UPI00405A24D3